MASNKKSQRAGFSLIETAIVLGVVGLVIGGIWVASASITARLSVNRLLDFTLSIQRIAASSERILSGTNGYHELTPLVRADPAAAGLALVSTNKLCADKWCVLPMYVATSGNGMLTINYYFVRNGSFSLNDRVPNPELCAALSRSILGFQYRRIDGTVPFIEWATAAPIYTTIGTYANTATSPPSMDQIMTYCRTATVVNVANVVP